jgi:hypothetical protein
MCTLDRPASVAEELHLKKAYADESRRQGDQWRQAHSDC